MKSTPAMALLLLAAPAFAAPDLQREVRFQIAAQPLESALLEFSRQAQVPVLINAKAPSARAMGDIDAPAVNGLLIARTALVNLLDDSGFVYSTVGNAVSGIFSPTMFSGARCSGAGMNRASRCGRSRRCSATALRFSRSG